ncbi:MAG TPA: ABC transporter ATP-binding protein [Rectinemataceae bacterium]|nr:ABC transporter ATP-binding protein [Rectinemataceae bacterium]
MGYELRSVSCSYGDRLVLDGISLGFPERSITVVLGPSGCGKSTLLNVVAGLKRIDSGSVMGFETTRFSYAFQEPRLLPWLSARENASFALLGALPRSEALVRVKRFISAAGLAEVSDMLPAALSGGMRQRLSLVRAFAYPSDILLLDEAFQAVDLRTKLELIDVFLQLWEEERRTVLCVTHDIEEAVYLADHIVVLSDRPARVIDSFDVELPREQRSLGAAVLMEAEARLYRAVLGAGESREGGPQ